MHICKEHLAHAIQGSKEIRVFTIQTVTANPVEMYAKRACMSYYLKSQVMLAFENKLFFRDPGS